MAYIAWVRYGTSNRGCDECLTTSPFSGALTQTTCGFHISMLILTRLEEPVLLWHRQQQIARERTRISESNW